MGYRGLSVIANKGQMNSGCRRVRRTPIWPDSQFRISRGQPVKDLNAVFVVNRTLPRDRTQRGYYALIEFMPLQPTGMISPGPSLC